MTAERERLAEGAARSRPGPWFEWGPYVSERAWGTVREDYSESGTAWESFPHEHARSRAYRWSEDGLAGVCDIRQHLCLALALWNERDPILKERIFGLTNAEGNHGEDAKEHWWYLDATPTHSWLRWRYHYPQRAFPYDGLVAGGRRARDQPELELVDTGIFDGDRWFAVTVDHAKAAPSDLAMRIVVENVGPDPARLHVLPTLWFRNTWSWEPGSPRPRLWAVDDRTIGVEHPELGRLTLAAGPSDGLLFCDNDTNGTRLWGLPPQGFPKDGIGDHVLHGAPTVNPAREGTKAAVHHVLSLAPGATAEVRVRLTAGPAAGDLGGGFTATHEARRREADEWYAELTPADVSADDAQIMRQAFAGMLWSEQYYHYDVDRWLKGDPGQPVPPASRWQGRNAAWRHLNNQDVLSVPDKWEYPWYASWDLGFHCVALAHVDPAFAKHQLTLLLRGGTSIPTGNCPPTSGRSAT